LCFISTEDIKPKTNANVNPNSNPNPTNPADPNPINPKHNHKKAICKLRTSSVYAHVRS